MWFDLVVNLLNFGIIVLGSELFVGIVEECSVLFLLEFLLSVVFCVMFVLLMRLVVLNVVFFVDMLFSLLKLKWEFLVRVNFGVIVFFEKCVGVKFKLCILWCL